MRKLCLLISALESNKKKHALLPGNLASLLDMSTACTVGPLKMVFVLCLLYKCFHRAQLMLNKLPLSPSHGKEHVCPIKSCVSPSEHYIWLEKNEILGWFLKRIDYFCNSFRFTGKLQRWHRCPTLVFLLLTSSISVVHLLYSP